MTDEAAETTTTTAPEAPADAREGGGESFDGPSDADLLAAVRAVKGDEAQAEAEGGESEAPEGVAAETEPAEKPAAAPAADDDEETELARLRKERAKLEKDQQARERLQAEIRAEVAKDLEAKLAAEREKAREEARREFRARFKVDPVGAFRDAEVDGAEAVTRLADAASPEGKLHQRIAELEERIAKASEPLAKKLEAIEQQRAQERAQYEAVIRQQEERTLISQVEAAAASAPLVRAYFDDDKRVVERAREIANEYAQTTGNTTCPFSVIVQELRAEAKREAPKEIARLQARIEKLSKLAQQPARDAVVQPTEPNGRPGQRTLGSKIASERRATPKPAAEMTDEERDEAARAAVRELLGPSKRGVRTIR